MELAYTQAYYRENIFPSLRPHQKVLLVPVSRVQPTLYLASCRRLGMAYSCRCSVFVRTPVHKRMALLPPLQGTFACTDLGLTASDTEVALKLGLYLKWAESDERIIGFNPCKRALCVVDEQWMRRCRRKAKHATLRLVSHIWCDIRAGHLMDWNPAKPPVPGSCGGFIGPGSGKMPKTMAVLRRIGQGIRNNSAYAAVTWP